MTVDFRDYPDTPAPAYQRGWRRANDVFIPVSAFGGEPPVEPVTVIDRSGATAVFVGGGPVYIVPDHEAACRALPFDAPCPCAQEFVGWSYWEDADGPAINLLVTPE